MGLAINQFKCRLERQLHRPQARLIVRKLDALLSSVKQRRTNPIRPPFIRPPGRPVNGPGFDWGEPGRGPDHRTFQLLPGSQITERPDAGNGRRTDGSCVIH